MKFLTGILMLTMMFNQVMASNRDLNDDVFVQVDNLEDVVFVQSLLGIGEFAIATLLLPAPTEEVVAAKKDYKLASKIKATNIADITEAKRNLYSAKKAQKSLFRTVRIGTSLFLYSKVAQRVVLVSTFDKDPKVFAVSQLVVQNFFPEYEEFLTSKDDYLVDQTLNLKEFLEDSSITIAEKYDVIKEKTKKIHAIIVE